MKALTVQQPWAWAIVHGGKTVENRTQAWKHRGPLAIHAGARLSQRGAELMPEILDSAQVNPDLLRQYAMADLTYGAIIGTVELVDVHTTLPGCCDSPWAEQAYEEHGGTTRRDLVHLVLEGAQAIDPIPCPGRLGLWTPPADVLLHLEAARV